MVLSLRVTISAVAALCVAVVAAITLSITLTSSLAALRDVGSGQAAALLESAQLSSESLFASPLEAVQTMQNLSKSDRKPWPANNATARREWALMATTLYVESRFQLTSLVTYFRDNTFAISSSIYPQGTAEFSETPPFIGHAMSFGTPVNETDPRASWMSQTAAGVDDRVLYTGNRTEVPKDTALYQRVRQRLPFQRYNAPGRGPWDLGFTPVTNNGTTVVNAGVIAIVVAGRARMYYSFIAPIHRLGDVPGVDEPYAFVIANLYFGSLDNFMRRVRATDGTLAVAVDNTGYLLRAWRVTAPSQIASRRPARSTKRRFPVYAACPRQPTGMTDSPPSWRVRTLRSSKLLTASSSYAPTPARATSPGPRAWPSPCPGRPCTSCCSSPRRTSSATSSARATWPSASRAASSCSSPRRPSR
jgi:hypothetical protein